MFEIDIITPEQRVFSGSITSLVAQGTEGYFGVLSKHAPLFNSLAIGELRIDFDEQSSEYYAIGGGFFEVANNTAIVLADTAEKKENIDVERARAAQKRAEGRITGQHNKELDRERAERGLKKALNRLRVAVK